MTREQRIQGEMDYKGAQGNSQGVFIKKKKKSLIVVILSWVYMCVCIGMYVYVCLYTYVYINQIIIFKDVQLVVHQSHPNKVYK